MKIEDSGKQVRRSNPWANTSESSSVIEDVPLDSIKVVSNPRTSIGFDSESIKELADTIKSMGLLQPITVRKKGPAYELIAGERRYRAFKVLKRSSIPAIVIDTDTLDPEKHPLARIVENLQRVDLAPGELGASITALIKQGWKQIDIAKELGKSKTWISRKVAHGQLVEQYPEAAKIETQIAASIQGLPENEKQSAIKDALAGTISRDVAREKKIKKPAKQKESALEKLERLQSEKKKIESKLSKINDQIRDLQAQLEP